jgi:hypothetical protein
MRQQGQNQKSSSPIDMLVIAAMEKIEAQN